MLAPHPDDFDAIGVTMKFFLHNGNPIVVGVARTGSGVEDAYRPGLTLAGKADLRDQEQRRSLQFFGLPGGDFTSLCFTNDEGDQLTDPPENLTLVEEFVSENAPDIVFLPHGNDTNSAHKAMYSQLKQVSQRSEYPFAMFLIRDPKTINMRTDLYMPFDQQDADWKAQLLRFHDTQHQRNLRTRNYGFDDRVLNVNREIARDLSLTHEYAEAYEVEYFDKQEISRRTG